LGLLLIGVVVDEEVPADRVVLAGVRMQGGSLDLPVGAVVFTSVDEQDAEASEGEAGSKRGTAGARADNDIVIGGVVVGSLDGVSVAVGRENVLVLDGLGGPTRGGQSPVYNRRFYGKLVARLTQQLRWWRKGPR
jgi:hypothetical protein